MTSCSSVVDSVVDVVVSSEVDSVVDVVPAVISESSVLIFPIEKGHGMVLPNCAFQLPNSSNQMDNFSHFF